MNKLKEKLNSKKDDDQLYGDLLATKLRRLSSSSNLRAKHEVDNIMFKYMLQNEEDQQANVQAAARDQFTSPPPSTSTPIQANSPVYHQPYHQPSYQQQAIPSRLYTVISTVFKQQESNVNQNPTFTDMLNNDFSSNPIMPGDLFQRLRENDKS